MGAERTSRRNHGRRSRSPARRRRSHRDGGYRRRRRSFSSERGDGRRPRKSSRRGRSPPRRRSGRHRRPAEKRRLSSISSVSDSSVEENKLENKAEKSVPKFDVTKTARAFPHDSERMSMKEKMQHQAMITTNPAVTRMSRRVYVGNLPTDAGLTERFLLGFFEVLLAYLGVNTPQALLSVWLSDPPAFCFLEMRSVNDATKTISMMENFKLGDKVLKVGRPPDYNALNESLNNFVVGAVPLGLDTKKVILDPAAHKIQKNFEKGTSAAENGKRPPKSKIRIPFPSTKGTRIGCDLMPVKIKPTIDGGTLVSAAFEEDIEKLKKQNPKNVPQGELFKSFPAHLRGMFMAALPETSKTAPSLLDIDVMPSRPCPPSLVVVVEGMVIPPELVDEREFKDIEYDIRVGAERYGNVAAVVIPRPGIAPGEFGVGKVFLEYTSVRDAMNAQKHIPRRKFMNRRLVAKFYEEYKYKAMIF